MTVLQERPAPLVSDERVGVRLPPPAPGVAVLACRCGTVLDASTMCRLTPRILAQPGQRSGYPIAPIVCASCARGEAW